MGNAYISSIWSIRYLPDQIFVKLAGNIQHLSDAFFQVDGDDDSKAIMTIHTHIGLSQVNQLQQGIKTAPAEFQIVWLTWF